MKIRKNLTINGKPTITVQSQNAQVAASLLTSYKWLDHQTISGCVCITCDSLLETSLLQLDEIDKLAENCYQVVTRPVKSTTCSKLVAFLTVYCLSLFECTGNGWVPLACPTTCGPSLRPIGTFRSYTTGAGCSKVE